MYFFPPLGQIPRGGIVMSEDTTLSDSPYNKPGQPSERLHPCAPPPAKYETAPLSTDLPKLDI